MTKLFTSKETAEPQVAETDEEFIQRIAKDLNPDLNRRDNSKRSTWNIPQYEMQDFKRKPDGHYVRYD